MHLLNDFFVVMSLIFISHFKRFRSAEVGIVLHLPNDVDDDMKKDRVEPKGSHFEQFTDRLLRTSVTNHFKIIKQEKKTQLTENNLTKNYANKQLKKSLKTPDQPRCESRKGWEWVSEVGPKVCKWNPPTPTLSFSSEFKTRKSSYLLISSSVLRPECDSLIHPVESGKKFRLSKKK